MGRESPALRLGERSENPVRASARIRPGQAHKHVLRLKWSAMRNPDDNRVDDVEKLLAEAKAFEDRKQALIADLLKQREAANKAFDEKLAKLGYEANSGKSRRSHHKKGAHAGADAPAKSKTKA